MLSPDSVLAVVDDEVLAANANVDLVVDGGVRCGHLLQEAEEFFVEVSSHLTSEVVL